MVVKWKRITEKLLLVNSYYFSSAFDVPVSLLGFMCVISFRLYNRCNIYYINNNNNYTIIIIVYNNYILFIIIIYYYIQ